MLRPGKISANNPGAMNHIVKSLPLTPANPGQKRMRLMTATRKPAVSQNGWPSLQREKREPSASWMCDSVCRKFRRVRSSSPSDIREASPRPHRRERERAARTACPGPSTRICCKAYAQSARNSAANWKRRCPTCFPVAFQLIGGPRPRPPETDEDQNQ